MSNAVRASTNRSTLPTTASTSRYIASTASRPRFARAGSCSGCFGSRCRKNRCCRRWRPVRRPAGGRRAGSPARDDRQYRPGAAARRRAAPGRDWGRRLRPDGHVPVPPRHVPGRRDAAGKHRSAATVASPRRRRRLAAAARVRSGRSPAICSRARSCRKPTGGRRRKKNGGHEGRRSFATWSCEIRRDGECRNPPGRCPAEPAWPEPAHRSGPKRPCRS